ncbi:hypothetical protein [Janibacter sp. GS2]|uniref:hypothetical protein n=1 Tax=Janibacter sp. GS2 TaxID=3442646 RepID=UPI003EBD73D6
MRSLPTLALTATLGVVGIAAAPAASAASPDDSVAYLAAQLAAGDGRLTTESGGQTFDDLGLTIDAVLGMSAVGSGGDASATATDYLLANASTYYGSGDELYSAATAKMLTFASARGLDPTDVNGVDLVAQLRSLEQDGGRFADQSEFGDYSNALGQSFGLIGLKRAGETPSTASVDVLLDQQCPDGGFALEFTTGCISDPDATATAVQALDAVGGKGDAVQEAAGYLESRQDADGGVGGGATTEGANANSTGLAAVAFRLAGRDAARADALGYLEALTFDCETPALAGGVAYNQDDFDAATAQGEQAGPDGTITRATAQAMLGLTEESYATVSAAGQSAAAPATDCDAPGPSDGTGDGASDGTGDDVTGAGDGAGAPGAGTGATGDSGTSAGSDGASTPEIPAVVQTDDETSGAPLGLLALGAGGLAAAVVIAARVAGQRR